MIAIASRDGVNSRCRTFEMQETLTRESMQRVKFQRLSAAVFLAVFVLSALPAAAEDEKRPPNFILIVADDLGYGDIGCFGNTKNLTPNLDRLASEGLRFTDFHSNGSMCSPTRAALLTGRYQQRVRIESPLGEHSPGLPQETVTIAERLKEAGYVSAIYGKWHLGTIDNGPLRHGFDEYKGHTTGDSDFFSRVSRSGNPDWWHQDKPLSEEGYNTDLLTDYAIDFMRRHRKRPFFLYLPHSAIHFPWQSPNDTDPKTHRRPGLGAKTPGLTKLGHHSDPTIAVKEMIESLDQSVGRLMESVRDLGLEENTFVFFTSDNGGYLSYNGKHRGQISSNGPLRGQKSDIFEGGHRVPAIARWPGRIAPGVTHETVMTMDLMPTYLRLAGLSAPAPNNPATLDGTELTSLLFQSQRLPPRTLFWRKRRRQAARHGPWKLIRDRGQAALYNLSRDIGERSDVAAKHPDVVSQLDAALTAWEKEVGPAVKRVSARAERIDPNAPWHRHTIDDTSRGADGTRLADVNGDGLLDVATPWEQGGVVRLYLNPGPGAAKKPWPAVTVGEVTSSEDAVSVDLDGDGAFDVVSACEGRTRSLFVHWAPASAERYLDPGAWKTEAFAVTKNKAKWMYVTPLDVDGQHGVDLICGAKGEGAQVGWLASPESPRDVGGWTWHPLYDAGWIMSLETRDLDLDGDLDVIVTDRRGPRSGCLWLENPGPGPQARTRWSEHRIGSTGKEAMFLWPADFDRDGLLDVLVANRKTEIEFLRRVTLDPVVWEARTLSWPASAGSAKAIAVGDIDLDGELDIVCSAEAANEGSGVVWLRGESGAAGESWRRHDISGIPGGKYDRIELIDLDRDGDLDVLTSEERDALGVIWYENPVR